MIPEKKLHSVRFLCAADLHLGRAFPHSAGQGKEHFVIQAWENLIAFALAPESKIDAVLLAGDIFDSEKDLYEAVYRFERGVGKLAERGIPVLAVAGNHDAQLFSMRSFFPRLPGFYVLGKGGTWESHYLELGSLKKRRIRIDGWSFPAEHFPGNPLHLSKSCSRDEIAIGLLHCECPGQKESPYAPVAQQDLAGSGHRAWVLGHVHIPQNILTPSQNHTLAFYCGSLQGLDSSEHGPRGATLLDVDSAGGVHTHFVPLAPFLWCHQIVALEASEEDLLTQLEHAANKIVQEENVRALAIRFFLQGHVRDYQVVRGRALELEGRQLASSFKGFAPVPCWIDKIVLNCQPTFDLELLAKGENIASQLARRLLLLEKEEDGALLEKAQSFLSDKLLKYPHLIAHRTKEELRQEMRHSAYTLLSQLMKQKEIPK